MMNGIVTDIDFFDRTLYGDEIKYKSTTEQELLDETNPDEYEDKTFRMKYLDDILSTSFTLSTIPITSTSDIFMKFNTFLSLGCCNTTTLGVTYANE